MINFLSVKKSCGLAKIENPLVRESATSLAKKIRNKELKCEEVVQAFVDRCNKINTSLNAIVDERYALAIEEAQGLDGQIQSGEVTDNFFATHPLLGVPFTATECLACEGMSWTLGILARKNIKAEKDGKAIRLMKEAGAILIAVTNVPQLGFWAETYNPLYGLTKNPYHFNKSVGGSSGGEACIVAACGSPIGIGTDIGGGLRIPANRCGVFGHKCSSKLVSLDGNPLFLNPEDTIAVVGPIVKFAEDLSLVLAVLASENISQINLKEEIESDEIQFFYSLRSFCGFSSPIRHGVEANMKEIVKVIGLYRAESKPLVVEVPETANAVTVWGYKIAQNMCKFESMVGGSEGNVSPLKEALKYVCGKREFCLYTIYNLYGLVALKIGNDEQLQESLNKIKETFLEILEGNSVLLFPTEPLPLAYPYESLVRPYNNSYCALWNALEFPVTQVPIGLKKGAPYGIQVVAAPYKDHLCIAAAKVLESLFSGYTAPDNP